MKPKKTWNKCLLKSSCNRRRDGDRPGCRQCYLEHLEYQRAYRAEKRAGLKDRRKR